MAIQTLPTPSLSAFHVPHSLCLLLALSAVVNAVEATPEPPPVVQPGAPVRPYLANAITPYEPIYFLASNKPEVSSKFQFSLAVLLVGRAVPPAEGSERRDGLYFSFSQTSLWDLSSESKPFYDSSYRPEVWWHQGGLPHEWLGAAGLDVQAGIGHESNGQSGGISRNLNHLFFRPVARWDLPKQWQIHVAPRIRMLMGLDDNPDLPRYRGIFDLTADIGQYDGVKVSTSTHIGTQLDRASFQMDLTYPMLDLTHGWINCYAHLQWFSGYAESLRAYDQRSDRVLIGLSFIR